jgi:hypothetical protein
MSTGREPQGSVEAVIEEILAARGTALAARADSVHDVDVERVFTETIAAFRGIDTVVHTTGPGPPVLYPHATRHLRRG